MPNAAVYASSLHIRYDASRVVDMKARAQAAGQAILDVLADIDPAATRRQMGDAAATAASDAYDAFADREVRQRERTTDGTNAGDAPAASTSSGAELEGGPPAHADEGHAGSERVPVSEAVLVQRPYFQVRARQCMAGPKGSKVL
jgi:hypothetical protein